MQRVIRVLAARHLPEFYPSTGACPLKAIRIIGVLLVLLGVLAFVVPIPHREDHSVKIGDAKFAVQTESSEKLPLPVGIVLVAAGTLVLVFGPRKS